EAADCDDNDADVHPGATEICGDDVDQDCDGSLLDADGDFVLGGRFTYVDADGDGLGDERALPLIACAPSPGHVLNWADCDDGDEDVGYPTVLWADADDDGYGDPDVALADCGDLSGFTRAR